jgi:hypothetical protein
MHREKKAEIFPRIKKNEIAGNFFFAFEQPFAYHLLNKPGASCSKPRHMLTGAPTRHDFWGTLHPFASTHEVAFP